MPKIFKTILSIAISLWANFVFRIILAYLAMSAALISACVVGIISKNIWLTTCPLALVGLLIFLPINSLQWFFRAIAQKIDSIKGTQMWKFSPRSKEAAQSSEQKISWAVQGIMGWLFWLYIILIWITIFPIWESDNAELSMLLVLVLSAFAFLCRFLGTPRVISKIIIYVIVVLLFSWHLTVAYPGKVRPLDWIHTHAKLFSARSQSKSHSRSVKAIGIEKNTEWEKEQRLAQATRETSILIAIENNQPKFAEQTLELNDIIEIEGGPFSTKSDKLTGETKLFANYITEPMFWKIRVEKKDKPTKKSGFALKNKDIIGFVPYSAINRAVIKLPEPSIKIKYSVSVSTPYGSTFSDIELKDTELTVEGYNNNYWWGFRKKNQKIWDNQGKIIIPHYPINQKFMPVPFNTQGVAIWPKNPKNWQPAQFTIKIK